MKLVIEYTHDEQRERQTLPHVATVRCDECNKTYRYGAVEVASVAPMIMMHVGSLLMDGCSCSDDSQNG